MSGIIGLVGMGTKCGIVGPPPLFVTKYAGSSYSVNSDSTIYRFDTIVKDTWNKFDNSSGNYKYVCPISGYYQFNYSGRFSQASGDMRVYELWIQVNEATTIGENSFCYDDPDFSGSNNHPGCAMSTIYYMNAGDRVRVFHSTHRNAAGALEASGTHQWFSGNWISS